MCLAVPGEVVAWIEREGPFARASVRFGAVSREVHMPCVPEVEIGDFVLVHAGLAIARIDTEEAARTLALLEEMVRRGEAEDEFAGERRSPESDASAQRAEGGP